MTVLVSNVAWVLLIAFSLSRSAIVIAALFAGAGWAAWAGLVFSGVMILVSIFYYNPTIILERQPGIIDWVEDLVFTGLLFVAATLLLYEILGMTLQA